LKVIRQRRFELDLLTGDRVTDRQAKRVQCLASNQDIVSEV
jgi:hypothetical protein